MKKLSDEEMCIDNILNRRGRPINPNFDRDVDALMKRLHSKHIEAPKDEVRVVMSLGTISMDDLEKE